MKNRAFWWGPLIALQFLTRVPVRNVPDWAYDEGGRQSALIFFPLVGALIGAVGAAACLLARLAHLPAFASAVMTVAATAWVTGAFHEDGIADTFDALGPHTRERALEVMRDSRIGTFGAVALYVLLTLKATAIQSLSSPHLFSALVCAHVLARWSSLPLAIALPYARDTTGLGAGIAALAGRRELLGASVITAVFVGVLAPAMQGLLFLLVGVIMIVVTGLFYRARFGGITGDCLGATNQIVEAAVLLAASSLQWR